MLETFVALAEGSRLRIVDLLRTGERPVGEIGEALALPQPRVSKHLKVLKQAGLVEVEARAQQRLYRLRAAPLRQLFDWLADYRALWEERFAGIDAVLADMQRATPGEDPGRPSPRRGPQKRTKT